MREERIGTIEHYYPKAGAAVLKVEQGQVRTGDWIHIAGHGTDLTERVERLEMDHRAVQEAHAGESVGVQVQDRVHEKADVFRVQWDPGDPIPA